MDAGLEARLKKALVLLDKASREFREKKASFKESGITEALRELVKEQVPNENSVHTAREAR
jgi:hypothetical protein